LAGEKLILRRDGWFRFKDSGEKNTKRATAITKYKWEKNVMKKKKMKKTVEERYVPAGEKLGKTSVSVIAAAAETRARSLGGGMGKGARRGGFFGFFNPFGRSSGL